MASQKNSYRLSRILNCGFISWFGVLAIIIIAIAIQSNIFLSWDVSWLLDATHRWLKGGTYYRDFFENNPPLILYLYSLPEWVSQKFLVSHIITVRIFVFLIAFLSLGISKILISKIINKEDCHTASLFGIGLAFVYLLLPTYEFGQREHLMLMLTMPYFLLMVVRNQNKIISYSFLAIIGFLAGIGFALKPYFLIPLVLIEIFEIFTKKDFFYWLRIEVLLISLVIILYFLSIFKLTPTFFSHVFSYIKDFYLITDNDSAWFLMANFMGGTWFVAILLSCILRKNLTYPMWVKIFNLAAIGFLLSYLLQGKFWYYHLLPMLAFSTLILILLLSSCLNQYRQTRKNSDLTYAVILILLISFFPIQIMLRFTTYSVWMKLSKNSSMNYLIAYTKAHASNGKIYFLSNTVIPGSTVVDYADVKSASRFPRLWLLPGILKLQHSQLDEQQKESLESANQFLKEAVIEDFQRNQPTLVFVDTQSLDLAPFTLDYLQYFKQSSEFNTIWKNYEYAGKVFNFDVYKKK